MGLLVSHFEANPTINATSGTLQKTLRKSFFKRFHLNSYMAENVFDTKSSLTSSGKEIVVLQVMLCGDNQFLMEAIYKDDYDKIFDNLEGQV